jgi:hypothetical protein
MVDLKQFCAEVGIDEDRAFEALAQERGEVTSALAMPWYVRLVVGVGAWVTAIAAIALGVAIISLSGSDSFETMLIMLGVVYLVLGLFLLRIAKSGVFATQLGAAISAAGVAMIAAGTFFSFEVLPALLVCIVLTTVIIIMTPNRTLQFLAALLTAGFFVSALIDLGIPYYLGIVALAGPAGMVLILRPFQRDLRPMAVVLLLVFPIFDWFYVDVASFAYYEQTVATGGWFAKALNIGLFLSLVAIHWRRAAISDVRTRLSVFAVAAIVVGLLLPPGGAAALMILMFAFVLGSRPLALLGILLQINYIWRFYYDMEVTLLIKSGILVAVGAALVLASWLMMRRSPEGGQS